MRITDFSPDHQKVIKFVTGKKIFKKDDLIELRSLLDDTIKRSLEIQREITKRLNS